MSDYSLVQIGNSTRWYIQWFEDGHSRRASTRETDRSRAEAVLAAFRLVRGETPPEDLTVSQVLDWYWETHGKDRHRPDNIDLAIRYLKPFFGESLAAECNVARQQAYVDHMLAKGFGSESIRRDLSTLSAALNRAAKHSKLNAVPPILSLTPAEPRDRWLSRQEVARLLWALRTPRSRHVLLFTRIALYTGARTMAILDLTWDRVDFGADLIDFKIPGRAQTKKRRTVAPMTPVLRRMLLHAKKRSRSGHVIEWAGQRVERVAKAWIAAAERVGIEGASPHVLRHTFATWAARNRVPIFLVGKALGQTVASTTERYAKYQQEDIAGVMMAAQRKRSAS